MTDDRPKTARTLLVADHLWEAFSSMAVEMGSEREALVNQALYTFARLNGFLVPGDLKALASRSAEPSRGRPAPAPTLVAVPDDFPGSRGQGTPERVAEIAQQLAGSNLPSRQGSTPPPRSPRADLGDDEAAFGREGEATSLELPALAGALPGGSRPIAAARPDVAGATLPGRSLVLCADGREPDRVVKDRFLIGRGKHCDLVIDSGKVSREHAAITREGGSWFIEDLGSSNGTWFDKRRISRRQIEDGDEYFICSEKLGCLFR